MSGHIQGSAETARDLSLPLIVNYHNETQALWRIEHIKVKLKPKYGSSGPTLILITGE